MDKRSAEKLEKVHPVLRNRIARLLANLTNLGMNVTVTDGLRTYEEQNKLYAQGRTKPGNRVTNARGGQSNHNFGLAVDLCPLDGTKLNYQNLQNFVIIGREAKKLGLEWGGDWEFIDRPHVQLKGLTVKECRLLYQKGGLKAVWERMDQILKGAKQTVFTPAADDDLEFGDIGGAVRVLQTQLFELNFLYKHEIDGKFGKITQKAVIGFQRQNNLSANGIVRETTKLKLAEKVAEKKSFSNLQDSEIELDLPEISTNSAAASQSVPTVNSAGNPAVQLPEQNVQALPPPNQTATVEETTTERSETSDGTTETKTTVSTEIFNAENISAFIPRLGKLKFLGFIPGIGFLSTILAYLRNAPTEIVFVLGFITGLTTYGFIQLLIKHREKVLEFINMCYRTTADPNRHNLIPVSSVIDSDKRQNELLGSLVKGVLTNGNVK